MSEREQKNYDNQVEQLANNIEGTLAYLRYEARFRPMTLEEALDSIEDTLVNFF